MCRFEKILSFTERGSLTENNGTITNVQLLMVMEIFNFFENFKNLLMGGHDEKLKNFGKSKKKAIFTNHSVPFILIKGAEILKTCFHFPHYTRHTVT